MIKNDVKRRKPYEKASTSHSVISVSDGIHAAHCTGSGYGHALGGTDFHLCRGKQHAYDFRSR